jgi:hypothetical protein
MANNLAHCGSAWVGAWSMRSCHFADLSCSRGIIGPAFSRKRGILCEGGQCRKVTIQTVAPTTGTSNPEELNSGASRFAGKNQTLTGHDLYDTVKNEKYDFRKVEKILM